MKTRARATSAISSLGVPGPALSGVLGGDDFLGASGVGFLGSSGAGLSAFFSSAGTSALIGRFGVTGETYRGTCWQEE
jgi:hypothetical protein